jgi:hypothetical protein
MQHLRAYKLATTYEMTHMYFLVNIHNNNQSILYKVNGVVDASQITCIIQAILLSTIFMLFLALKKIGV